MVCCCCFQSRGGIHAEPSSMHPRGSIWTPFSTPCRILRVKQCWTWRSRHLTTPQQLQQGWDYDLQGLTARVLEHRVFFVILHMGTSFLANLLHWMLRMQTLGCMRLSVRNQDVISRCTVRSLNKKGMPLQFHFLVCTVLPWAKNSAHFNPVYTLISIHTSSLVPAMNPPPDVGHLNLDPNVD